MIHITERTDFLNNDVNMENKPSTDFAQFQKKVTDAMEIAAGISKHDKFIVLAAMLNALQIDFSEFANYYYANWNNS